MRCRAAAACMRRLSATVSITTKTNLQKRTQAPAQRLGISGGFHAPQMVVGDRRIDSRPGRRITGASDANLRRLRFEGAKGNTMSALLYIPPNASAQTPAPGILAR